MRSTIVFRKVVSAGLSNVLRWGIAYAHNTMDACKTQIPPISHNRFINPRLYNQWSHLITYKYGPKNPRKR
ncbi:hypothetical protein M422DRAFT_23401 [Sphaerobolus stellatus SS14]|nr:hypothetical protein M422DRAFT_23401 [Sphaerobolus stellatus SS14]